MDTNNQCHGISIAFSNRFDRTDSIAVGGDVVVVSLKDATDWRRVWESHRTWGTMNLCPSKTVAWGRGTSLRIPLHLRKCFLNWLVIDTNSYCVQQYENLTTIIMHIDHVLRVKSNLITLIIWGFFFPDKGNNKFIYT